MPSVVLAIAVWLPHVLNSVSAASLRYQDSTKPPRSLKFGRDGTFQISILEDLHFGESTSAQPTKAVVLYR